MLWSLIHNGYDEDDFAGLNLRSQNSVLTLGYNGTFSRLVPLKPVMSAISEIHRNHGIDIKLNIASPTQKKKLASQYPYLFDKGLIEYRGFLPHKESLENLYHSDIALLILNDIEATEGMIPAKTFEYLRIGRPILLLHRKRGHLAEIIQKTETGITVDITDQNQIVQTLLELHHAWRSYRLRHQPKWDAIREFDRSHLCRLLVDIFKSLV